MLEGTNALVPQWSMNPNNFQMMEMIGLIIAVVEEPFGMGKVSQIVLEKTLKLIERKVWNSGKRLMSFDKLGEFCVSWGKFSERRKAINRGTHNESLKCSEIPVIQQVSVEEYSTIIRKRALK